LWRGLVQITYTLPWRRTSLQFSQMRFTLERTFMTHPGGPVFGAFFAPKAQKFWKLLF
jgi:hypothetical protein